MTGSTKPNQKNFRKANYEVICEELIRVDWEWILTSSGVCVQLLYDHILHILSCDIEKCIPFATLSESNKKLHHLSKTMKEKSNLYCKSRNDPQYISAYKAKCKQYD